MSILLRHNFILMLSLSLLFNLHLNKEFVKRERFVNQFHTNIKKEQRRDYQPFIQNLPPKREFGSQESVNPSFNKPYFPSEEFNQNQPPKHSFKQHIDNLCNRKPHHRMKSEAKKGAKHHPKLHSNRRRERPDPRNRSSKSRERFQVG